MKTQPNNTNIKNSSSAAGTGSDKINKLFGKLNSSLKNNSNEAERLTEYLNELKKTSLPESAKKFMADADTDLFYELGINIYEKLIEEINYDLLQKIAHEYLNLFRFPSFLKRIYEQDRWEKLILNLLDKSNYNVRSLFYQRVRDYKNKNLFNVIKDNSVIEFRWEQSAKLISSYEKAIIKLLADENAVNGKVAFLLENSLEMALLDLACLTNGIVNVMIPAASVPEHIKFILNQTEAPIVFVHNEKQLAKIKSVKNELTHLQKAVLLRGSVNEDWVVSLTDIVNIGRNADESLLNQLRSNIKMDSLATIMYTSGTTGEPKGIMFSQMNIVYKRFCRALAIPAMGDDDRFLCYLPLFHTFGRFLEMMGSVFWAAEYYFMENPAVETMISNMQLVKPTIFISIPKKWIQLYDFITTKTDIEIDEHNKIKTVVEETTGGKLKWGLSAAGYLPPDIFRFFQQYGIELMSGFGMTEATGGITMTPPAKYKPNSLGKALPGINIKLGDDGEILINGPYVMIGYYKKPDEETFTEDGWLATGDIMKMDDDGFIEIIDRKKEIYKNVKGETIAPQKIENYFRDFETVKQVFLVGDHRPFNTVLIFPDDELENSPLKNMNEQQKQEYFSSVIVTVNKFLSPFERILDFKIINRPFSDEHGELTPKGTYKRRVIEKNFYKIIEEMYTKTYSSVYINNREVRIPNWFLREKGCLSRDIIAAENKIKIPKLNVSLSAEPAGEKDLFRIGSYIYRFTTPYIDFQQIIMNPVLWIGNEQLIAFTGISITQWNRQTGSTENIKFHSIIENYKDSINQQEDISGKIYSSDNNFLQLHNAQKIILSEDQSEIEEAIDFFKNVLSDETNPFYQLTLQLTIRAVTVSNPAIKKKLFAASVKNLTGSRFKNVFTSFIGDKDILDDELIKIIVENSRGENNISVIEEILQTEIEANLQKENLSETIIPSLLKLITWHGIKHPASFKRVRRFLMRYAVFCENLELKSLADSSLESLQNGFRDWLGKNQEVAVDQETGDEYRWDDVLAFEQGIDAEDRLRIKKALIQSPLLREAVFLFSNGVLLRLDNLLPGGLWISLLENKNEKSIYRIAMQTRYTGSFDVTLHLNKNIPPAIVKEEIKWLIAAGATVKAQRLLPHFGGYWADYDLWTEAFVPRASVAKFIQKSIRRKDKLHRERLFYLWPHFVWNASAAYISFWRLTNYKIELANPLPDNITIPTHDYQSGTLLYSVSQRKKSSSVLSFLNNFYNLFVKKSVDEYTFLENKSIWNYIISGIVEAEGEERGIQLIKDFISELNSSRDKNSKNIIVAANSFLKSLEEIGFIPHSLYFAIKRFHRWYKLNKEADLNAQAQMLFELYETYRLFELEKEYHSTRTQFFLKTAFNNSSNSFKQALIKIIKKQNTGEITNETAQVFYTELHTQFKLNAAEKFFLTRLTYPHLKPTDSAEIIKPAGQSVGESNLVVQLLDAEGISFLIRNPISPKEISRLHSLFLESNLTVNFSSEHRFLVAVSERGFIIGGLFYHRKNDSTAHMEKIVVSSRYRRKGISESLMNELFNRLKSEHFSYVTTGFFRPEYFYKFGFKVEKKYSGLVKELTKQNE